MDDVAQLQAVISPVACSKGPLRSQIFEEGQLLPCSDTHITHQGGLVDRRAPWGSTAAARFDFGRFVAWKEVLGDCVVNSFVFFSSRR